MRTYTPNFIFPPVKPVTSAIAATVTMQIVNQELEFEKTIEPDAPICAFQPNTSESKRHKRDCAEPNMGKELTADQKAVVKMYVSRDAADGVKCCYCGKEITSRNIDRWASHLRGCFKTPDDIKAKIQPTRGAAVSPSGSNTLIPVRTTQHTGKADLSSTAAATFSTTIPLVHTPNPMGSGFNEVFKVHVSKDYMKFNSAHFIAYKGFREKLHGHNYRLAVTITGQIGSDGYVVDFGDIKKISRVICRDLNESFLVPMNSDALNISFDDTNVNIETEDMAKFSFPKADCSLLPIVHSSAEELAIYISNQLIDAFTLNALLDRGARKLEVSISEANQQFASYERTIIP